MAIIANTFLQSGSDVNREELGNVVSRITPEDTPIYSMIKKSRCDTINPEDVVDDLAAVAVNQQAEGDEYSFSAITKAKRTGNFCQIFRKTFLISGTQEAVSNAASVEKMRYQTLKHGVELRKDVELAIVLNNASVKTDPRETGGLPSWIETNESRGTSGAEGGFSSSTSLTVASTDGTQRAFTKAIMDNVMQQCYESGANVKSLVVSPYVKSVFVSFMSNSNVAAFRNVVSNGKNNSMVATADIYEGPFGMLRIVPNRVMASGAGRARNAFFIDPSMLGWKWLRRIRRDNKVAKTGDAMKRVIIGEGTLWVHNEKAQGVAADLFGLTSAT